MSALRSVIAPRLALGVEVLYESVTPADLQGLEIWALNAVHGIRIVTSWIDGPPTAEEPGRLALWQARIDALRKPLPDLLPERAGVNWIDAALTWVLDSSDRWILFSHRARRSRDPARDRVLVGLIVPGDTVVVVAATAIDGLGDSVMLLAVILGALAGESIGFATRAPVRAPDPRVAARAAHRDERSAPSTTSSGAAGTGMFVSRFLPVLHSLVPVTVGIST